MVNLSEEIRKVGTSCPYPTLSYDTYCKGTFPSEKVNHQKWNFFS